MFGVTCLIKVLKSNVTFLFLHFKKNYFVLKLRLTERDFQEKKKHVV